MTSEIPKFPKRESVNMECSMIVGDYETWRVETIKILEKMYMTYYGEDDSKREIIQEFLEALK